MDDVRCGLLPQQLPVNAEVHRVGEVANLHVSLPAPLHLVRFETLTGQTSLPPYLHCSKVVLATDHPYHGNQRRCTGIPRPFVRKEQHTPSNIRDPIDRQPGTEPTEVTR